MIIVSVKTLTNSIKQAEDTKKKFEDKARDPNVSSKQRELYENQSKRMENTIVSFYKKKKDLSKARDGLVKKNKELSEQKEFIADVMLADDLEAADAALTDVIKSIQGVSDQIDTLAQNVLADKEKDSKKDKR